MPVTCKGCGSSRRDGSTGLCPACSFLCDPLRPAPALRQRPSSSRLGRVEDYWELRSWGHSIQQAADRMRISRRTAERYETLRHLARDGMVSQ